MSYFCETLFYFLLATSSVPQYESNSLADCQDYDILGQLVWIIPVSIVGGILLLGVLLFVFVKIILVSKHSSKQDVDLT